MGHNLWFVTQFVALLTYSFVSHFQDVDHHKLSSGWLASMYFHHFGFILVLPVPHIFIYLCLYPALHGTHCQEDCGSCSTHIMIPGTCTVCAVYLLLFFLTSTILCRKRLIKSDLLGWLSSPIIDYGPWPISLLTNIQRFEFSLAKGYNSTRMSTLVLLSASYQQYY